MTDDTEFIPIYTVQEYAEKVKRERGDNATVRAIVLGLERKMIDGVPCLVVYHVDDSGEFGVVLDRQYADELTKHLGPHPMVEEFFRLH